MQSGDYFEITGTGGKKTLSGSLEVGGAKNAALPLLAATLLSSEKTVLENVPNILDTRRMTSLLKKVGATVEFKNNTVTVKPPTKLVPTIDEDIGGHMRASIILTAPLLARTGEVTFPHPGGCVIGKRPIDLFLSGFESLGATVKEIEDGYHVSTNEGLTGAHIFFPLQSHTATETLMMTAVCAEGTTVLENASTEPEIVDLADFLNACGADIKGAGTHTITITGTGGEPLSGGITHRVMPDRLEAGSFIIIAALLGKDVVVEKCNPDHLTALLEALRESGVEYEVSNDSVRVLESSDLASVSIKTHEYPGFPTDLQAPFAIFLTQTHGRGSIFETIFEGRLAYAHDLKPMEAIIDVHNPHKATIEGPQQLHGTDLKSPDIRAGLAYITAALVAEGTSEIQDVFYVDRGYERIEEKLQGIGAQIKRVVS